MARTITAAQARADHLEDVRYSVASMLTESPAAAWDDASRWLDWHDYVTPAWVARRTAACAREYADPTLAAVQVVSDFHDEVVRQHQVPLRCKGQRTLKLVTAEPTAALAEVRQVITVAIPDPAPSPVTSCTVCRLTCGHVGTADTVECKHRSHRRDVRRAERLAQWRAACAAS